MLILVHFLRFYFLFHPGEHFYLNITTVISKFDLILICATLSASPLVAYLGAIVLGKKPRFKREKKNKTKQAERRTPTPQTIFVFTVTWLSCP